MSNLDKTGAQLIDSIRKTKAAPATAATTASKEKHTTPKAAAAPQTVRPPAATPYPDGSTVWPD